VGYGYDWAKEAHHIFNDWILNDDIDALTHYEKGSKSIQLSIPAPEHYLPLIYALGMKEKNEHPQLFNDELLAGSLSMTSVKWG
jgi:4,5-DOPA dioxygenase extradiol